MALIDRLKKLDTEELARLASELETLTKTPGWTALLEISAAEAEAEEQRAVAATTAVLRQAKPFSAPEPLYRWMGKADGIRAVPAIVDTVLKTWAAVQAQLEREARG